MTNTLKDKNKSSQSNFLSKNLSKLLDSHQVSEYDLAKNLNIPYNTINRIINGTTTDPRLSTLQQIADFFGVNLDFLVGTNEQSKNISIPLMSWDFVSKPNFTLAFDKITWEKWVPVGNLLDNIHSTDLIFALESTKSMHTRFPVGTLFVLQTNLLPIDGDLVLIKFKTDNSISLRELTIDSPNWLLNPIVTGSQLLTFNQMEHEIIAIVILTLTQTRTI
ncbi:helix-turn-helix domain-containing protein [Legionella sp. MW5194]|uniref:helix-turn-helix domain-containing protein n=1 Tax=Legionella sp. MW5194 TaxID=2662448 RepID=UPI00193CB529|nr:helix-turn-helix transcriptional regulator [Legionella sp. MW5194]QRN04433.1 helix-turn-helix domain-containing protein [Legionella sp. MW5194]